jgi:3-hydroxyisobutyrate dehydrogenase-like beta-hydroxyacid dehydrogenase
LSEDGATTRVGFIGFGEVASTFSVPLVDHGVQVAAYDILLAQAGGQAVLQRRTRIGGIRFLPLHEMLAGVDYVLCTAATHVAKAIARESVPYLRPGQVYVDLNSISPGVKVEIAEIVARSGASFVEGAILGAVGATGAATRILLGGSRAEGAATALAALGLNASFYSPEVGKASTFKMLRSIFSKGLEALLLEFLTAGKRAGIQRDLWEEVTGLMRRHPFEQVAANWVQSHAMAHERRYHEMVQVAETMRELGVEPLMTVSTEAFFRRSLSLGFKDAFPERPDSMEAVIDFMEARLAEGGRA